MGIRDRATADFAPGWRPDIGDEVFGVVTGRSSRTTEMRGVDVTYDIVTVAEVQDDEATLTGESLAIHCVGKALADDIGAVAKVGDYVYSKYNGLKRLESGNQFHDYKSAVVSPGDPDFPPALADKVAKQTAAAAETAAAEEQAAEEPF